MDDLMETNISESITNLILLLDAADFCSVIYKIVCIMEDEKKERGVYFENENWVTVFISVGNYNM